MTEDDEELIWYYLDAKEEDETKQSKGPYSGRDLDVLIRTCCVNSGTLMFRNGYETWTTLFDIPELRQIIQEQSKEIFQLQSKIEQTRERRNSYQGVENSPKNNLLKDVTMTPEKKHNENGDPPILDELVHFEAEIEELQENPLDDEEKKDMLRRKLERNRKKAEKDRQKKRQLWYTPRINTNIYIKGLPEDITEEVMADFFGKAGIIRINQHTLKPTIKIYRNEDGKCKGDGLVSYKMFESVQIAREVLDEKEIQPGYKVSVEQATFEQRGDYVARETKRLNKLQKDIAKQKENNLMGWEGDQEVENHGLKIVVLEHMFVPDTSKSEDFYQELERDVQDEVQESVGEIQKLELFRDHPQGIIKIKFASAYDADQCICIMNDRFFDQRQVKCFYWDGKTDYKRIKENHQAEEQRLDEFGRWLEQGELNHQKKMEQNDV